MNTVQKTWIDAFHQAESGVAGEASEVLALISSLASVLGKNAPVVIRLVEVHAQLKVIEKLIRQATTAKLSEDLKRAEEGTTFALQAALAVGAKL